MPVCGTSSLALSTPSSSHRSRSFALAGAIAALVLAACTGSRAAAPQAPVELVIAPIGSAVPKAALVTNGEASGSRCSLRLVAARIVKSSPGCYLDEHISEGPGTLLYPCSGDGPAEAEFGGHRYVGQIEKGEVTVELSSELDWEDGCHWGTQATISGSVVADGEPTLKRLSWSYLDRVLNGKDCSGVCRASSSFAVSSAHSRRPSPSSPKGDPDDDDFE